MGRKREVVLGLRSRRVLYPGLAVGRRHLSALVARTAAEEPEEPAVVVVEVVDEAVRVSGAGRVGVEADFRLASARRPQQRCAPEHEERVIVNEVQHCQ